jgi:hypothetical protein
VAVVVLPDMQAAAAVVELLLAPWLFQAVRL